MMMIKIHTALINLIIAIGFYALFFNVINNPLFFNIIDYPLSLINLLPIAIHAEMLVDFVFYAHIFFAVYSLIAGGLLVFNLIENKHSSLYKTIVINYVLSVSISALFGIYIIVYSISDLIAFAGYLLLYLLMILSAFKALQLINKGRVLKYQLIMIYSYSLCLSVLTLMGWDFILEAMLDDSLMTQQITAWEGWLPNLFIAHFISNIIRNKYSINYLKRKLELKTY